MQSVLICSNILVFGFRFLGSVVSFIALLLFFSAAAVFFSYSSSITLFSGVSISIADFRCLRLVTVFCRGGALGRGQMVSEMNLTRLEALLYVNPAVDPGSTSVSS